jgi:hypothetical protein
VLQELRAAQCFRASHTAERTLEDVEAMHLLRKEQVKRLAGRGAAGQAWFVASLFGSISPSSGSHHRASSRFSSVFATQPFGPQPCPERQHRLFKRTPLAGRHSLLARMLDKLAKWG